VEKCGRDERATDYNRMWRMLFAFWIPKATDTHLEYAIVIAFPQQQRLSERACILRHTYIAWLVEIYTRMSVFDVISTFSKLKDKYRHVISCV
jgi:hypothetical protein